MILRSAFVSTVLKYGLTCNNDVDRNSPRLHNLPKLTAPLCSQEFVHSLDEIPHGLNALLESLLLLRC